MAFDRTDPADLAALKSEVIDDPISMGYDIPTGTQAVLDQLNDPALNVGGDSINRPTEEISIPEIAAIIDPIEYGALAAYNQEWVKMFISRPMDETLEPYQAKFLDLFGNGSTTRTAALGLRAKLASRAEVLFGVNTVITRADLLTARDS